jgi:hypothetical protein
MAFSLVTPTYSLAFGCFRAGFQSNLKVNLMPDQDLNGNVISASAKGLHGAMSRGAVFLRKSPSGELILCRMADNATFENPITIRVR